MHGVLGATRNRTEARGAPFTLCPILPQRASVRTGSARCSAIFFAGETVRASLLRRAAFCTRNERAPPSPPPKRSIACATTRLGRGRSWWTSTPPALARERSVVTPCVCATCPGAPVILTLLKDCPAQRRKGVRTVWRLRKVSKWNEPAFRSCGMMVQNMALFPRPRMRPR